MNRKSIATPGSVIAKPIRASRALLDGLNNRRGPLPLRCGDAAAGVLEVVSTVTKSYSVLSLGTQYRLSSLLHIRQRLRGRFLTLDGQGSLVNHSRRRILNESRGERPSNGVGQLL